MIVESLVDVFFRLLSLAFQGFEFIGLPMQAINALQTLLVYGTWVVGADILAIFTGMIVMWWTVKLSVGLFIWLWELLPLT